MSISSAQEEALQPTSVVDSLTHYVTCGDPQAFTKLVEEYQGMVLSTCRSVLGWGPDAEDAAQEAFIKLARHAASIQRHPGAWLHAVARTTALDVLSRRQRERRLGGNQLDSEAVQAVAPEGVDAEGTRILHESVQALPVADREVLIAYFWQGRTQDEIASGSGISQVAVKKRLDRILHDLGRRLRSRGLGAAALAMLVVRIQAEEVPITLAERLATLDPGPLWQPVAKPLLSLIGIKAIGVVIALAGIGLSAWMLHTSSGATPLAYTAAAPLPVTKAPTPEEVFPTVPIVPVVVASGLPAIWNADEGLSVEETAEPGPQGDPVKVLRLESKGFDSRILEVPTPDLAESFVLEYDFRFEVGWCPSHGLSPGVRSDVAAKAAAKRLTPKDNNLIDDDQSVGVWRHMRMEVVRDLPQGQMRITSDISGASDGGWMIASTHLAPCLLLRVTNCRVLLANWRITPKISGL